MPERKKILLRLDPAVHDALARWAADELRSTNAQIEHLLRSALADRGRLPRDVGAIPRRGRPRRDTEPATPTEPDESLTEPDESPAAASPQPAAEPSPAAEDGVPDSGAADDGTADADASDVGGDGSGGSGGRRTE